MATANKKLEKEVQIASKPTIILKTPTYESPNPAMEYNSNILIVVVPL